jgi:hypothetical protein
MEKGIVGMIWGIVAIVVIYLALFAGSLWFAAPYWASLTDEEFHNALIDMQMRNDEIARRFMI